MDISWLPSPFDIMLPVAKPFSVAAPPSSFWIAWACSSWFLARTSTVLRSAP